MEHCKLVVRFLSFSSSFFFLPPFMALEFSLPVLLPPSSSAHSLCSSSFLFCFFSFAFFPNSRHADFDGVELSLHTDLLKPKTFLRSDRGEASSFDHQIFFAIL